MDMNQGASMLGKRTRKRKSRKCIHQFTNGGAKIQVDRIPTYRVGRITNNEQTGHWFWRAKVTTESTHAPGLMSFPWRSRRPWLLLCERKCGLGCVIIIVRVVVSGCAWVLTPWRGFLVHSHLKKAKMAKINTQRELGSRLKMNA